MSRVCGADEAGRGPLAGAVFAAAVILDPARAIPGLADSKVLSASRRDELALIIRRDALAWCIAEASVEEIDRLNILHASMLAMSRAIAGLSPAADEALIDGNRVPKGLRIPARAIVKGDATVAEISAASILAKTARDAAMVALDVQFPVYGFARHKGYPTAEHLAAIEAHGVLGEWHRKTFGPVRAWLARQQGQLF
ncbi:ribonuclease HII [Paludibacterium yongneupense]|uniref:ribonuclease HII n=1 Tax=Paludibacterium yongneupense TaxID=400061 RepID=UPI0004010946|nr:ribonuclease HII [Paludibacterium yongneupense]